MIQLGQYNTFKILSQKKDGLLLIDDEAQTVFLPKKHCPETVEIDDEIEVFVYQDNTGQKLGTLAKPKIRFHEFAMLRVTAVAEVGAFMDWGIERELFVPFREQKQKMEANRWYIVYLDLDLKTDRLYASSRLDRFLQNDHLSVKEGEEVEILIRQKTDLGFSVIVNHRHTGLIFENEIFKPLRIGEKVTGFIKKIHPDNKIDIALQPAGYDQAIQRNTEIVLTTLSENKGFLPLTDSSPPEEISEWLGISKKAFKKAVGALYKEKNIRLLDNGIELISQNSGSSRR